MTPQHLEALVEEIDRATSLATDEEMSLAVKSFDLAREMAHVWADQDALVHAIRREEAGLAVEREHYRKINHGHGAGEDRNSLLILGDSLGLPRPERKAGAYHGAENTYGWMLGYEVHGFQPTSMCQRYFTTGDALRILEEEPGLTKSQATIIHLGLNDCANRMFLARERLALSLLKSETREKIVGFARKYRKPILRSLPSRHYVDRTTFRRNLDVLIDTLRRGGCEQIILTTIILPPSWSWPATPGVNENFASYNLEILSASARNQVTLFDLDRLIAEYGVKDMLIDDGMHLSDAGHTLFTREAVKLLKS